MPGQIAPWLEDLSEDWVAPPAFHINTQTPLDDASDRSQRSRFPRRSSGAFSPAPSDSAQQPTSQKRRSPLAELSSSAGNVAHQSPSPPRSSKLPTSRSVSVASAAGSVVRYDTVERRAKSESPEKQHTLEWKKRLIDGDLGYGDHTDLFGPSPLQNIFQAPARSSAPPKSNLPRLGKQFRQQDFPPSSPPPWPSSIDFTAESSPALQGTCSRSTLGQVQEVDLDQEIDAQHLTDYNDENDPASDVSPHGPDTSPYQLPGLKQSAPPGRFLQPSSCRHPTDRTISGQTDYSGEAFSPVFISKHTTVDGSIAYATVDPKSLNHSQVEPTELDLSAVVRNSSSRSVVQHNNEPMRHRSALGDRDDVFDSTLPSVPDVSLPNDLPTGTPPATALGHYVNVERGGLSARGSFKTRPLSPSQPEDLSRQFATEGGGDSDAVDQASDCSVRRTPRQPSPPKFLPRDRPGTPMTTNESSLLSPPKTRPSASPLKLFGTYDTFTNNRLLRRMSQLEDLDQNIHAFDGNPKSDREVQGSAVCDSTTSPVLGPASSVRASQRTQGSDRRIRPSLSSFGEGDLDDYDFEADLSIPSALDLSDGDSFEGSPPPEAMPPGSRTPFRFHVEESHDDWRHSLKLKRKLSKRSTARSRMSADYDCVEHRDRPVDLADAFQHVEGKRPRTSPTKGPTSKRRRTIVALNGEIPSLGVGSQIQVKITGASTDGSRSTSVDETGSWNRRNTSVARPRNPTPSQYRREQILAEVGEATLDFLSSSPRLEAVKETLDLTDIPEASLTEEQVKCVAAEVAAFTLNISKDTSEGKRSRSITTQDFLDEAMHIMSLIRAKGGPRSCLGSVEESEAEESQLAQDAYGHHLRPEDIVRSPSPLRLSRPPSREGGSTGWRPRSQLSQDPRIVSQLRKFREEEDGVEIINSSLQSLNVSGLHVHADQDVTEDTLSNVRIRGPRPETSRSRGQSDVSQRSRGSPTKTHQSNPSLDSSSSRRTIGTHSTHKSDNVATLAPETVAHLIPEEVAGMTFDKDTQRWVRIKGSRKLQYEHIEEPVTTPSNLTSDDDPFNDIPDLTVDEMKELTRIGRSPSKDIPFTTITQEQPIEKENVSSQDHFVQAGSRVNSNDTVAARPVTRENQVAPPFTSSSAPSKYSVFGSSQQQQVDTRATSWSNEELARMKRSKLQASQTGNGLLDLAHVNAPHPISDIPEHLEEDDESSEESLPLDDSVTEEISPPKQRQQMNQPWLQSSPASMYQGVPRPSSLRRQTLHRGLYSAGQDQSELSFVATLPDKRIMSVSFNVSKPSARLESTSQDLVVPTSSPQRADGTFYLSDLPDFTVNEEDDERPSEKILAKRIAHHAVGDRYAMAVQGLVKTLTDVEPDEPYWEDIKQLSLCDRDLGSIHNLEDFCHRLEDLDLSNNNIAHLEGAPSSIRRLNVRSNALSSLTAWSHLMNLQYLDISGNSVDSLAGLCMLVHLREVRADDNQISSLDGIMGLDGLLKLSVRRNSLTSVDFEGCQLKRLEELDMSGNQISEISQVESLPSLSRLVLDDNELTVFAPATSDSRLTSLSLINNQLQSLNVSSYPGLRYLNVDENQLVTIKGLGELRRLDMLCMRKQRASRLQIFEQHLHARSLHLSSNNIASLTLPCSYHSVQHLELASCGLQDLPADFGLQLPNLRALNVSFNAIKDIRPLLNIARLEALIVSGNRISRLRKTVATLARMKHLRTFDARDNPFTLGFYPPPATAAPSRADNERDMIRSSSIEDMDTETEAQIQQRASRAYVLPAADSQLDTRHCSRLDEDSKLRRRVHELLLSQSCKSLERLDGLNFDRARVATRDDIWNRLVGLGVMRKSQSGDTRVSTPCCELEV